MGKNDDAVAGYVSETGDWIWEELYDQTGRSEDMSFVLFGRVCTCLGEVNGDGKVNATDLVVIAGWIGNYGTGKPKSIPSTDTLHYVLCADANLDGKINATDVVKIAGWIGSYGSGKPKSIVCPHSYP
jgi:hypothetical protein